MMKIRRVFGFVSLCVFVIMVSSCSVEKVNLSPITGVISQVGVITPEKVMEGIEHQSKFVLYSSEITNSFRSVEDLSDKKVNIEVSNLKFYVTEFLYATKVHNTVARERALYKYEKYYKKVQNMKDKLSDEEQEILNRFLVKVKTNISLMVSLKDKS